MSPRHSERGAGEPTLRLAPYTVNVEYRVTAGPPTLHKNIAEVLDMPCSEALEFFSNQPVIARHMQTMVDVGLGYVRLGQPAPQLSGGEAQRVKLASELSKRSTGPVSGGRCALQ